MTGIELKEGQRKGWTPKSLETKAKGSDGVAVGERQSENSFHNCCHTGNQVFNFGFRRFTTLFMIAEIAYVR